MELIEELTDSEYSNDLEHAQQMVDTVFAKLFPRYATQQIKHEAWRKQVLSCNLRRLIDIFTCHDVEGSRTEGKDHIDEENQIDSQQTYLVDKGIWVGRLKGDGEGQHQAHH